jgi:hypothetical protein
MVFACLTVQTAVLAAPAVRQFDTLPDGTLAILADFGLGHVLESVAAQELRQDQKTPVGHALTVKTVPAAALLRAKEYPYGKPVVNLFIGFAGNHHALLKTLGDPGFAEGLASGFAGLQAKAVNVWIADPAAGGGVRLVSSPEKAGVGLAEVAGRVAAGVPGWWGRAFGSVPYTGVRKTFGDIRAFAQSDADARAAAASVAVVFWAGGRETDTLRLPPGVGAGEDLAVSVVEAASCNKQAAAAVQAACASARGEYIAYAAIKRQGASGAGAAGAGAAFGAAGRLLAGACLFGVKSVNLEDTASCWFRVSGAEGGDAWVAICDRSAGAVKEARRRKAEALAAEVEASARRDDFAAAFALLPELETMGGDRAAVAGVVFARMRQKALAGARETKYAAAFALAEEFRKAGGDAAALRKEIHGIMTAEAVKLADAAEFGRALTLYDEIAKTGGDAAALGNTLGTKIGAHAVDLAGKAAFAAALECLELTKKTRTDAGETQANIVGIWKLRLATLAGDGKYDEAAEGAAEMEKLGLLQPKQKALLNEELLYKSGLWFAAQSGGAARALELLGTWREAAKAGGRYAADAEQGAAVARERARLLSTDAARDADCAGEINELARLRPDVVNDAAVCGMIGAWLTRDGGTAGLSARLAALENWEFADAALKGGESKLKAALRFFRLAASPVGAAAELKAMRDTELASEALDPAVVDPKYTALNRALALTAPLRVVLESLPKLGVTNDVTALLADAVENTNIREASFYRVGNVLEKTVFTTDPAYIVGIGHSLGLGIGDIAPAFLERLHGAGNPVLLEGTDENKAVVVWLLPRDGKRFLAMPFSGETAPAVRDELVQLKMDSAGVKSLAEMRAACLTLRDMRDAELLSHFGLELLGRAIWSAGTDVFLAKGGKPLLQAFNTAVPVLVRGYAAFDKLAVAEGGLTVAAGGVSVTAAMPTGWLPKHEPGVMPYAIWAKPCFELGLPVFEDSKISGFLRAGFRTLER